MAKLRPKISFSILAWLLVLVPTAQLAQGQESSTAVARGVLLYQPFCDECPAVLDEFLYPVSDEYGARLELLPIDTSQPLGSKLLASARESFDISGADTTRPILVIGDRALVGREQIVGEFTDLLESTLAAGGSDWPAIPGLADHVQIEASDPQPAGDPVGMAVAWVIMAGMLVALLYVFRRLTKLVPALSSPYIDLRPYAVPLLAVLGIGISSYLFYIKVSHGEAVCGPLGDCNLVQNSPYASILGIPMSLLGLLFYLGICALFAAHVTASGMLKRICALALVGAAVFGTIFSVYLTSLELFVIHAVCAWCLTSAVLTTLIMLLTIRSLGNATPREAN